LLRNSDNSQKIFGRVDSEESNQREEIMRPISSPTVLNAVVALVVVPAIAVGIGIGQARADDCLAAPNVAAPSGQHWYYRIDRVKRRKCWYLHAPLRLAHQAHSAAALASATIDHPAPAAPEPASAAPVPAAQPPMPAPAVTQDNTSNQPQVTVLAVKTIAIPTPVAGSEMQSRHGVAAPAIRHASARAYRATQERKSEPTMFFVLVFGLGAAAFLMAIVVKGAIAQAGLPLRWGRLAEDMAWRQEQPDYSGAGAARLKRRSRG
jgi:hypothetical protein